VILRSSSRSCGAPTRSCPSTSFVIALVKNRTANPRRIQLSSWRVSMTRERTDLHTGYATAVAFIAGEMTRACRRVRERIPCGCAHVWGPSCGPRKARPRRGSRTPRQVPLKGLKPKHVPAGPSPDPKILRRASSLA